MDNLNEIILTLSLLKGYGKAMVSAVMEELLNSSLKSVGPSELYDFLVDLRDRKVLKGKAAEDSFPDMEALRETYCRAMRLLEKSETLGIGMVSQYASYFPGNLLGTVNEDGKKDVPLFLFYRGDLSITKRKAVAIIGTREPTIEGVSAGEFLGKTFASKGFNIVSGLALGCDSAGHRGALSCGGPTTAFLAHGLDTIYPQENRGLAEDMVSGGGLLMSEYPIGVGVSRYNLVSRDRLQAGLADAVLVIQTGVHGGTMHAVRSAHKAGKPIYALQYSKHISSDMIGGNESLISKGVAAPLRATEVKDVIAGLLRSASSSEVQ